MAEQGTMVGIRSIGRLLDIANRSFDHAQMVIEIAPMSQNSLRSVSIFYTHPPLICRCCRLFINLSNGNDQGNTTGAQNNRMLPGIGVDDTMIISRMRIVDREETNRSTYTKTFTKLIHANYKLYKLASSGELINGFVVLDHVPKRISINLKTTRAIVIFIFLAVSHLFSYKVLPGGEDEGMVPLEVPYLL